MNNYISFTVINNNKPLVLIDWFTFTTLLKALSKTMLIEIFADSTDMKHDWKKLSRDDIIHRIFIEYETDFPR